MAFSFTKFFGGINLKPNSVSQVTSLGDLDVTVDGNLNFHNGVVSTVFVSTTQPATLTNKTIDADANFISNIDDANIKAGANISVSKLAPLTVDRALISDSSGVVSVSAVTATELGYVSGVTSGIQAQINALVGANAITALTGDVTATGPGSVAATIANNAVTNVKIANGAVDNSKLANEAVDNSKVSSSAAIAYTKLNLASSIQASDQNSEAATNRSILMANGSGGATYSRFIAFKGRVAGGASYADFPNKIPITIVDYDTDSGFNTGTFEYTVPAGGAGYYNLTIQVSTAGSTTSQISVVAAPTVNGVFAPLYINPQYFNGSSYSPGALYTTTLLLADGDVVAFNSWLSSTGFAYGTNVCTLERLR